MAMYAELSPAIEAQLNQDDAKWYGLRRKAAAVNIKAYNEDMSYTNEKNMDSAVAAIADLVDSLTAKYTASANQGQAQNQDQPSWESYTDTKSKADVLRYLQETGWEIKKSTFYESHCASGKLKKSRKGLYTRAAVKKYAETWLVHTGLGSTVPESEENLAREKTQAEIVRIKTSYEHERYKLDVLRGKHIDRAKLHMELSARAVVLDNGLDYIFKTNVHEMVALVDGVADKAPLLLDYLLRKKDEQLTHYANLDEFTVLFEE